MVNDKIPKEDGDKLEIPSSYRSIMGSLWYLTETKPDLMFSYGLLSRFMTSLSNIHTGTAKRVLRYLPGNKKPRIWCLKTGLMELSGYSDSDWVG